MSLSNPHKGTVWASSGLILVPAPDTVIINLVINNIKGAKGRLNIIGMPIGHLHQKAKTLESSGSHESTPCRSLGEGTAQGK